MRLSRRATLAGALLATPFIAHAAEPLRLRCSLDTAPTHGRNVAIGDFLRQVEQETNGEIKTELFSSGALFPDLDVSKALIQGQAEMACPGTWALTGFIPDADLSQLPPLYGQPLSVSHKVIDGRGGQLVAAKIEERLRSHVLGPWLDLGFSNWYSTSRPLNSLADLKGLKIRNSGGAGQAWRTRFVGGIPNTTAWPNVPLALSQGTFDGLVTTDESVASSQLWEAGVKYSLADHQFIGEYIPMISLMFWNRLSPQQQTLLTGLWARNIPIYRDSMAAAQTRARATMESHGIKIVDPSPEQTEQARKRMLPDTEQLARDIKISPEIVKIVQEDAGVAA